MKNVLFSVLLGVSGWSFCQTAADSDQLTSRERRVAITIDDVPNTRSAEEFNNQSKLLEELDRKAVPVTIFINEKLIYRGDSIVNKTILEQWMNRSYVTPGNHTYLHSRYSDVGYDAFSKDILKGEKLTRSLASKQGKELRYFRFPFNDLGKDSAQHVQMQQFLSNNNYISTPFTVETSDWMFGALYEMSLNDGDTTRAMELGEMYVEETIKSFRFFDSLMIAKYGRRIDQIYLCHDNRLNEDYLARLIDRLDAEGYAFISLDEAMKDEVYDQEDTYWKKWGISWCYRWMNATDRKQAMMSEPNLGGIEEIYLNEVNKKQ